ncbi:MAG: hypothetical protein GY751_23955 [Bacteroidetes bacterium]|nr:hypothetical protein [Bacteroidota bacterium]
MSEFYQKLIIAILAALLGGTIGFGSNYYFAEKNIKSKAVEFARKSQFEFLKEIYDERKEFYIEIEAARFKAINDPTDQNMEAVVEAFISIPFIQPRLPTNRMILGFRDEIEDKITPLKNAEARKDFLRYGMHKYSCIFDVNLQTIESMMALVANSTEAQEIGTKRAEGTLALLDNICIENFQPKK